MSTEKKTETKKVQKDTTANKSEKKPKSTSKEKKTAPQLPVKNRKVNDEEYLQCEQFLNI